MAKELQFPLDEGGTAQAGRIPLYRAIVVIITLVCSAFILVRSKKVLFTCIAALIMGLLVVVTGFVFSYGMALFFLAFRGIGSGIVESLVPSIVEDEHPEGSAKWMNKIYGFFSLGIIVTALLTGFWLSSGGSWRWAFMS